MEYIVVPSDLSPGVIPLNTDLPENTMVEEIVVYGKRIQRVTPINNNPSVDPNVGPVFSVWAMNTWNSVLPVDQLLLNGPFSTNGAPLNPGAPPITIETPGNSADFSGSLHVALLLEQGAAQVEQAAANLSNSTLFYLPQNNMFFAADFISKWDSFSFKVTNIDYGNGAGGRVNESQLFSEVNYKTISNPNPPPNVGSYYGNAQNAGLYYYLVHETVHTLSVVKAYRDGLIQDYKNYYNTQDASGFNASEWGKKAEVFTNIATKEVLNGLGLSVWQGAPYGYTYTPTPGQSGPGV